MIRRVLTARLFFINFSYLDELLIKTKEKHFFVLVIYHFYATGKQTNFLRKRSKKQWKRTGP